MATRTSPRGSRKAQDGLESSARGMGRPEPSEAFLESLDGPYTPGLPYRAWTVDHDPVRALGEYLDRYGQEPAYLGLDPFGTMLVAGPIPQEEPWEPELEPALIIVDHEPQQLAWGWEG